MLRLAINTLYTYKLIIILYGQKANEKEWNQWKETRIKLQNVEKKQLK